MTSRGRRTVSAHLPAVRLRAGGLLILGAVCGSATVARPAQRGGSRAPDRADVQRVATPHGLSGARDIECPLPALRQRGLVLAVRHYGAVRRRTWPTDFAGGAARSGTFSSAIIAWSCRPDARVASTVLALRARAVHRERVFGPLTGGGEEGSVGIPKGTLILWSAHLAGRNAAAWPDPLRFDPDRFVGLDDDRRALAEMTWVPFGRAPATASASHWRRWN